MELHNICQLFILFVSSICCMHVLLKPQTWSEMWTYPNSECCDLGREKGIAE